jgi:hypothetical protein
VQITGGGIQIGTAYTYSGSALLTSSPAKNSTSITVSGTQPPTGLAWLIQCDTNTSAANASFVGDGTNCIGTRADNGGIYVCHLNALCSAQYTNVNNPHDQL